MLKKSERLKNRFLFNLAFKKKQLVRSKYITMYYLFTNKTQKTNLKTAFIVGLGVDKKATKRNQIKRRLRESYKQINKPGFNISVLIWIANPPIKNVTFLEIKKTMQFLIEKIQDQNNTKNTSRVNV